MAIELPSFSDAKQRLSVLGSSLHVSELPRRTRERVGGLRQKLDEQRIPFLRTRAPRRPIPEDTYFATPDDIRARVADIERNRITERKEPKSKLFKKIDRVVTFLKEQAPTTIAEKLFHGSVQRQMENIFQEPELYERRIQRELRRSLNQALNGERNGMRNFQERMLALSLIPDPMFGILLAPAFTLGTFVLTNGYNTIKAFAHGEIRKGLYYLGCTLINPIPTTVTAITIASALPRALATGSIELIQHAAEQIVPLQGAGLILGVMTNTAVYERISTYQKRAMTASILTTAKDVLSNDPATSYHRDALERVGKRLANTKTKDTRKAKGGEAERIKAENDGILSGNIDYQLDLIYLAMQELDALARRRTLEREKLESEWEKAQQQNFIMRSLKQMYMVGRVANLNAQIVDSDHRLKLLKDFEQFFTLMRPAGPYEQNKRGRRATKRQASF